MTGRPTVDADPVVAMVGLARALSVAGVATTPDRVAQAVRALAELDPNRRTDVYWAARLTFCSGPADLPLFDAVFDTVFSGTVPTLRRHRTTVIRMMPMALAGGEPPTHENGEGEEEPAMLRAAASSVEVLRNRDVSTLTAAEREALNRALAALTLPGEPRRSRRWRAAPHGSVDPDRTVRALLHSGGEPARLLRRTHRSRPRRVVLLVDVSGSMSAYADALLRFAHAASRRRGAVTEVFTIGTRLSRVTQAMSTRDPEAAMAAVAEAVPDWSGGTRLGPLLREFLDRWGQRGMARGAVVVVLSDGWEREDPALLGEQMARLSRLAHRVVWANPRKALPGYAPLAAGMAAALPYVDDFVEGHSLAALRRLARVVAGVRDSSEEVRTGA
ncbi:MAG TPA: VWA domain-containing protein [Mycobacteriales bacterium]|jgi:Protein containing von Willebrand factor type A (vWA) domain